MSRHLTNTEKGWVLTVLAVPTILVLWLLADGTRPYLNSATPVRLDIERGMRTRDIAAKL
jgi:hypothetical protein